MPLKAECIRFGGSRPTAELRSKTTIVEDGAGCSVPQGCCRSGLASS
ncbi:MAG TPA: hypothetical protein VGD29_19725 [Actinoplanes sp.]|jgi:hypothetical protein